jgi:tRNA-binding EMAP/Myf-like protein
MFERLFQELQRVLNQKILLEKSHCLSEPSSTKNLRGVDSQGMILMTTNTEGKLVL